MIGKRHAAPVNNAKVVIVGCRGATSFAALVRDDPSL